MDVRVNGKPGTIDFQQVKISMEIRRLWRAAMIKRLMTETESHLSELRKLQLEVVRDTSDSQKAFDRVDNVHRRVYELLEKLKS